MKAALTMGVIAAAIAGCAIHPATPQPVASSLGRYHFDYMLQNRARAHVSQVFDDGQQTFIAIVGSAQNRFHVAADEGGAPLPYSRSGMYVVIPGVHPKLFITSPEGTTTVANNGARGDALPKVVPSPEPPATASWPAEVANPEVLAARGALLLAQKEIADLREQLAMAKGADASAEVSSAIRHRIESLESLTDEANGVIVSVEFGYGSIDFQPHEDVAQSLVLAAKNASHVTLRSFTDSKVADASNKRIALARALTARRFLINAGVPANKIRAFYQSAGGFIADNTTREGRAKNRRVEIQLVPDLSKVALADGDSR